MALLQALPDCRRTRTRTSDAVLRQLAAQFAPEDLQLLYQIAIIGGATSIRARCARRFRDDPAAHAGVSPGRLRRPWPPAAAARRRPVATRPASTPPPRCRPPSSGAGRESVPPRASPTGPRSSPRSACRAAPVSSRSTARSSSRKARSRAAAARPGGAVYPHAGRSRQRWPRRSRALRRGDPAGDRRRRGPGRNPHAGARDALATADRQRAAAQSIDSDPTVRAMREVRRHGQARFGEAAGLAILIPNPFRE